MTPHWSSRRGTTLAELLAALPLLAVLGVVAVQLALAAHRRAVHTDATFSASRELRQSANVLAVELRTIRASDVHVVRDTAIEFNALVGVGIICAADPGRSIAIAMGTPADAWTVAWMQSPQPGDDVVLWRSLVGDSVPIAIGGTLAAVRPGAACAGSPIARAASGSAEVLELQSPLALQPAVGTPIRVTRRTRYSVYRSTDGDWYLGRRTLGPTGWDVIQPVAGPLLSSASRGLEFTAYSTSGARIGAGDSVTLPARIGIVLRAPRRIGRTSAPNSASDSLEVQIALRGDAGSEP